MLPAVTSILAVVVLAAIVGGLLCVDDWSRDLTTNHARLTAQATEPALRPVRSDASAAEMTQRIRDWAETQPLWDVIDARESDTAMQIQLTRTTRLLRFTDDVTVTVVPAEDGCRVDAESRSRIGQGDLGQNPRNLRDLVIGIRDPG